MSDTFFGGISTDIHLPPIFDNFKLLRCAVSLFNVNDSQLGSDCFDCFDWNITYLKDLQSFIYYISSKFSNFDDI